MATRPESEPSTATTTGPSAAVSDEARLPTTRVGQWAWAGRAVETEPRRRPRKPPRPRAPTMTSSAAELSVTSTPAASPDSVRKLVSPGRSRRRSAASASVLSASRFAFSPSGSLGMAAIFRSFMLGSAKAWTRVSVVLRRSASTAPERTARAARSDPSKPTRTPRCRLRPASDGRASGGRDWSDISNLTIGAWTTRTPTTAPTGGFVSVGPRLASAFYTAEKNASDESRGLRSGAEGAEREAQVAACGLENVLLAVEEFARSGWAFNLHDSKPNEAERIGARGTLSADLEDEAHGDRMLARIVQQRGALGGEVLGDVER